MNDLTPLDAKRKGLGVLAFAILVLAFVPVPMMPVSSDYSFELTPGGETNLTIEQGGTIVVSLTIDNVGNSMNAIVVYDEESPAGWNVSFRLAGAEGTPFSDEITVLLNSSENATVFLCLTSSPGAGLGSQYNLTVGGLSLNSTEKRTAVYNMTVSSSVFSYDITTEFESATPDDWTRCTILVHNNGTANATLTIAPSDIRIQSVDLFVLADGQNSSEYVTLSVPAQGSASFSIDVYVNSIAEPGDRVIPIEVFYNETLHRLFELPLTIA